MGQLSKIRRLHLRQGVPIKEVARRLGLSKNTVKKWLRADGKREQLGQPVAAPTYPARISPGKLDAFKQTLSDWLKANAHRNKRERKSATMMHRTLVAMGYTGSYSQVARFARNWKLNEGSADRRAAFVPLAFPPGDAAQFDWSTEYVWIGGLRRRVSAAHMKLCCSRAFVISAYPSEAHEMLFDAHNRAFAAFGGVPERVIYDNMKTAVDRVRVGKVRVINARFQVMCGHYLFEPEFCTVAAGWEKGIVEKNVQDARRGVWADVCEQRWESWQALNAHLLQRCQALWAQSAHPQWPELTVAECLQDECPKLMVSPKPFDGYVELLLRVSPTGLIHIQRNRYSVPIGLAHEMVSVRLYPHEIAVVANNIVVARHTRSFERDQTTYDWQHYIDIVQIKPGSLRNGAPFATMPEPFKQLQRHLMQHAGGDRVMATVLSCVARHGLEAVLVSVEIALESGRVSAEHVMNVLSRLTEPVAMTAAGMNPTASAAAAAALDAQSGEPFDANAPHVPEGLTLAQEPRADAGRYESLREANYAQEPHHVQ